MSRVKIGALVPYPLGRAPGQRFRIEQWAPVLRTSGIDVEFVPFANEALVSTLYKSGQTIRKAVGLAAGVGRRFIDVLRVRNYDVIFLYRTACLLGPAIIERLLKLSSVPIIFDFDDAIFLPHSSPANSQYEWLKAANKTQTICRLSNHITVGNNYLAEYARQFCPKVTVIPSSIDTDLFVPIAKHTAASRQLVVGWSGSSTSQAYLEMFGPVLRRLMKSRNVQIRVHSDREPNLPGLPYEWRPWSAQTEREELSEFDIGIMPLVDDRWSRGKCGMKALLYMSLGIPAVCSAVGANLDIITNGTNGFLARREEDWMDYLTQLIDNPELRSRIGAEGRKTVEGHFSGKECARRLKEVVLTF